MSTPRISKSAFANYDGRVSCLTPDCWGDLVLFPTGRADQDGIPGYQDYTACPLCSRTFELDEDIDDRELYLRIAWLRANPGASQDVPGGST